MNVGVGSSSKIWHRQDFNSKLIVQQVIMLFDRRITGMLDLVGPHNDALPLFLTEHNKVELTRQIGVRRNTALDASDPGNVY